MSGEHLSIRCLIIIKRPDIIPRILMYICVFIYAGYSGAVLSMADIDEKQGRVECKIGDNDYISSSLRSKINNTVISLKKANNGIIHEDISSVVRPYFIQSSVDLTSANNIVSQACLNEFRRLPTRSGIDLDIYRSYSLIEKGFSSNISISIDIELEKNNGSRKIVKVNSYLNFNSL